jgi:general secretion pathway protein C
MPADRRLNAGHLLLAGLAILCAWLGLRAAEAWRAPVAPLPQFGPPALADRALVARFDPFFPAAAQAGASLPVTALPFSLHGVRHEFATGRGSAIIAAGDGEQRLFLVGETIADGAVLSAVFEDHVVIARAGVREALWIDAGGAAAGETEGDLPGMEPPPAVPEAGPMDDPAAGAVVVQGDAEGGARSAAMPNAASLPAAGPQ